MTESYIELEAASHKLRVIEANREVLSSISFKGTAAGTEESARRYMEATAPIVKELKEMLKC